MNTRSTCRVVVALVCAAPLFAMVTGCAVLKPYEKEHLLDPTMADDTAAALEPKVMISGAGRFEKLGQGGGLASGSSCPTCGG